jgi:ACT domain-containing protein
MADVVQKLKETIEDFEVRVKNGSDDCAEQHRQLIDRLEKKLVSLQDLEAKQWDEKLKGAMPPHIFDRLNAQTVTEIEEVQHALYEAKSSMPEPVDLQERIVTFQAALDALQDPDVPVKKANLLLKECIELIVYHRDKYSNGGSLKKGIEPPPVILKYTLRI